MLYQLLQSSFIAFAFFAFLVLVEILFRRRAKAILFNLSLMHLREYSIAGRLGTIKRFWRKEDRIPSHSSRAFARAFVLFHILIVIFMAQQFMRGNESELLGNFLSFTVIFASFTLLRFFHIWNLGHKQTIMQFFSHLETRLLIDITVLIISGIIIFSYQTSELALIERAQQLWTDMGIVKLPLAGLIFYFLIPLKTGTHPFPSEIRSIGDHYSGEMRSFIRLLSLGHYVILSLVFIYIFWGGGNDYGLLHFPGWTLHPLYAICLSITIKYCALTLSYQILFSHFPVISGERVRTELKRWCFPLMIGQIVWLVILYMR